MANDTVATNDTLERPSQSGQVEQASESQAQGESGNQTSNDGKSGNEQENIRKLQSTYDRKLAEERKNFEQQQRAYNQQIAAMQQRLAAMEDASAPDDFARLELQLRRAEQEKAQYASAYQQAIAAQQAEQERKNALMEIADEFDVPVKALEDATDYKSAVKLAIKAQQDAEKRKQTQDDERREANRVDVGGGRTSTPSARWEQEYEEAQRNRDSAAQIRLLRQRGK